MPIYEYLCQDCNEETESLRSVDEADHPMVCSACGGENVKRKLSMFFAQSGGSTLGGTGGGCSSCAGGDCSSCGG